PAPVLSCSGPPSCRPVCGATPPRRRGCATAAPRAVIVGDGPGPRRSSAVLGGGHQRRAPPTVTASRTAPRAQPRLQQATDRKGASCRPIPTPAILVGIAGPPTETPATVVGGRRPGARRAGSTGRAAQAARVARTAPRPRPPGLPGPQAD